VSVSGRDLEGASVYGETGVGLSWWAVAGEYLPTLAIQCFYMRQNTYKVDDRQLRA